MGTKMPKIALQGEGNLPYYVFCYFQSNAMQNFMKKYYHSHEIETSTPNDPLKKLKTHSKGEQNHIVFQSKSYKSIPKNICGKFHNKENSSHGRIKDSPK